MIETTLDYCSNNNSADKQLFWCEKKIQSRDGLMLLVRETGTENTNKTPIICLPGLSRHGEDFSIIAEALAIKEARRVFTLDSRGRGGSDWDENYENYSIPVELDDLISVLGALGLEKAIFFGTSRGGLLTMLLGLVQPQVIEAVILNDIGPVIETRGLQRIKDYVGKLPKPQNFKEASEILQSLFGATFPNLSYDGWLRFAKRTWHDDGTSLNLRYDPNIMRPLAEADPASPTPNLWPAFETLKDKPLLIIRGGLSDLLSQGTAEEMCERSSNSTLHIVPNEGHAPLLEDESTISAILDFVGKLD